MKKPSKEEVRAYVAEMAEQLAVMCKEHDRTVYEILRGAVLYARKPDLKGRKR